MASSILHKRLQIGGMTCISCQHKIERTLRNTAGIEKISVSYRTGSADITYDTDLLSLRDIIGLIESLDYKVLPQNGAQPGDTRRTVSTLLLILALYLLLQQSGLLNRLVPSQLADSAMSYGMLFVIGLITSVHCIAMCGGINLSQCIPRTSETSQHQGAAATMLPSLLYNLGRVISYTVIGFVLGLVGLLIGGSSGTGPSAMLQGILKLVAGACMVIMGINMLGLFPWLRTLTLRLPKSLTAKLSTQKAKSSRPLVVGLLNGLMPCGPLQSMQIVALASGNPFAGAFSMLLFSLGTVPLMLGLGSLVSALGRKFTHTVMNIGAVLVVVLGLAMLSQGGSLSGLLQPNLLLLLIVALCILGTAASLPFSKPIHRRAGLAAAACAACFLLFISAGWSGAFPQSAAAADSDSAATPADGVQLVTSTLSPGRYPNITVQAGTPVKWVIDAPAGSINGCNYKMLLPEYDIEYTLQEGENTIEFTPTEAGTYQYSCWMGMIRGNIFVTPADGSTAAGTASANVPLPAGYQIPSSELAVAEMTTDDAGNVIQQVTIQLTETGFQPAIVVVQQDVPTFWTIQNSLTSDGGTQLLAPYYAAILDLVQGENPLSVSPTESFEVSTGDNAFYAYVKVVEEIDQFDAASIQAEVEQFETLIYPSEVFSSDGAGASCCG